MVYPRIRWSLPLLLIACQRLDVESSEESSPVPTDTSASSGTNDDDEDDEDDASDPTEDSEDPDTGGPDTLECDPIAQTGCNGTEKCTVVLQAGEPAYVCVSDETTNDPLASCEPALDTGTDGCPAGYACLADETEIGLCAPLCLDNGDCINAVCVPDIEHDIPYCAEECSPFEGGCASPLQCRRLDDRFACSFVRPNDIGGQGDPCTPQEDAGCAEGFVCIAGALVPGCSSDSCCSVVCDVNADTCDSPATCVPLFDAPAPGSESIGGCLVPS